ncbi:magnesium/cobalt transporter CorA [Aureitalea sp. L0-47]|uniref:magnesium/cobalt transporter CorA n=1 Tax=Aureitalea sp. L0-47 TaxID=2816962 RepID=UPI0022386682|nr:magnesium/cobalt transporter CorA [Aureitalea sp. L0-47]MCW5519486.1 magnesium/cobalt transporter CorA [Aureitalea sp. L0-47]
MAKNNRVRLSKFKNLPKRKARNYSPGTVKYIGTKDTAVSQVEIIDYSPTHADSFIAEGVEEAFRFKTTEEVTWINVDGLSNVEVIEKLGEHYNLHPLILEDIVTTNQRPRLDEYEDYLFIIYKMLYYNDASELVIEHVSMVVGFGYVVTFQEADGDVFGTVRDRILKDKGRIRRAGSDYLMFALLDAIVDNYFAVIDSLSDRIELIEDVLFDSDVHGSDIIKDIQLLKREVLKIKRAITPLREVINRLEKSEIDMIDPKTNNYLRDLYNHILQISESLDLYREMTWGLMDMHMTNISNRMNEIMKVLTIMASIFIPLTFMAGIYGMNFDYMPELKYKYGYFVLWGLMLLVFLLMLWYFRRKKWI